MKTVDPRSQLQQVYFQQLLAGSPDPVVLHNAEHAVIKTNPAFEKLFGYSEREVLGRKIKNILVPAERRKETASILRQLKLGLPVRLKTERKTKDGETIPVTLTAFAVRHEGVFAGYISIYRDHSDAREVVEALKRSEERYHVLFENAVEGIFMTTPEGRYLDANPTLASIYGFASSQELIEHFRDISRQLYVDPTRRDEYKKIMEEQGEVWNFQSQIYRKDGSTIWISENSWAVYGEGGPIVYQGTVVDITERRDAQAEIETQRTYFRQLFENSPQAICLLDPDGIIRDVNNGYEELFGYSAQESRGQSNRRLVVPVDMQLEARMFNSTILSGQSVHSETYRCHKNGRRIPVSVLGYPIHIGQNVAGINYIYNDRTQQRDYEEQLSHQAFHDSLTGLPNRALFLERLDRAVERSSRRPDYRFAIFMIDLDRFKLVNDSLGHHSGDKLLVEAARRMTCCIRSADTVARLGGDEFGVLLEEYSQASDITEIATRIQEVMEKPFLLEGQKVVTNASIGIVLRTSGYQTAEDILRDADIAMYRAKSQSKAGYKIFNKKMYEKASENLRLENELRQAISSNELELHYQPIVCVSDQRITGFEALVRWNHPRRGLIAPSRFIPLAEETGLIIPIGEWVIRAACRQMRIWIESEDNAHALTISVNISSRQLMQRDLPCIISRILEETGLEPRFLKLEITESAFMRDAKICLNVLRELKKLKVKLVVDDFGTGYSSLSYLQLMPIDMLKIDRSFISGGGSKENLPIVRTIIALARNLGLQVVAEGVEQEKQLHQLILENCDEAQGYLFSKPLDALSATKLIGRLSLKEE